MRFVCICSLIFVLVSPNVAAMQRNSMPPYSAFALVRTPITDLPDCSPYFRVYLAGEIWMVSFSYFSPGYRQPQSMEVEGKKVRFIQSDAKNPEVYFDDKDKSYQLSISKKSIEEASSCSKVTPEYTNPS